MEEIQMWEIVRKKAKQTQRLKNSIKESKKGGDLNKIMDQVLCFSISDMINFADYYKHNGNSIGEAEDNVKKSLLEWFDKTS
jgi:hypothetical protein